MSINDLAAKLGDACYGFLALNFHPARIFLGDVGSIPLGFLAGALGFWGWRHDAWPIWFPALEPQIKATAAKLAYLASIYGFLMGGDAPKQLPAPDDSDKPDQKP